MALKMTKGQQEFVDQMTRKLIVHWCDAAVKQGEEMVLIPEDQVAYRDYAITKKWLSASDGVGTCRILSNGWATAARFLKR